MPLAGTPCTLLSNKLSGSKQSNTERSNNHRMPLRTTHIVKCASSAVQTVRQHVVSKTRSAKEVTQQYLQNIAATEDRISSFISFSEESALQQVVEPHRL